LNSSLVELTSHQWGNINSTRFLGRIFDDILLEVFYYQLENKFLIKTQKHWLRLLFSDKSKQNECVLRDYNRSSGAFIVLHQCDNRGHPVCQCEPQTKNYSTEIQLIPLPIISNETIVPICENCTDLIADEDLINNETNTETISEQNAALISKKKSGRSYRTLLIFVSGPLLALIILLTGAFVLFRYVRHRGSYSTRAKQSSTTGASNETLSTPAVIYTRLKAPPSSIKMDGDMIDLSDDNVQLLPQFMNIHESIINEDEEDESLYATVKTP
jgi:hypothetical protein